MYWKSVALMLGLVVLAACGGNDVEYLSPEEQLKKDIERIETYISAHNIQNVQTTESGLRYVITQGGAGANASVGDNVTVHYTGKLLNGVKFDSSVDRGSPFQFQLGRGQVIYGWDEGIQLFNKGAKGVLYIPSVYAYGTRGAGSIGPNEVLVFDIELIDIN